MNTKSYRLAGELFGLLRNQTGNLGRFEMRESRNHFVYRWWFKLGAGETYYNEYCVFSHDLCGPVPLVQLSERIYMIWKQGLPKEGVECTPTK